MKSTCQMLATFAIVLICSTGLYAHHGVAIYDAARTVTWTGNVTEFHFANPHTIIYFDVKDPDGNIEKWQGELTSPNLLERMGWTTHSLKPGDTVRISGHPAKNGARSAWIVSVAFSDGRQLDADMK